MAPADSSAAILPWLEGCKRRLGLLEVTRLEGIAYNGIRIYVSQRPLCLLGPSRAVRGGSWLPRRNIHWSLMPESALLTTVKSVWSQLHCLQTYQALLKKKNAIAFWTDWNKYDWILWNREFDPLLSERMRAVAFINTLKENSTTALDSSGILISMSSIIYNFLYN